MAKRWYGDIAVVRAFRVEGLGFFREVVTLSLLYYRWKSGGKGVTL